MQHAYIVADSGSGIATMVLEELITPEVALDALSRISHYHELDYDVGHRYVKGRKNKEKSNKVAITVRPRVFINELPEMVLHEFKEIARLLDADMRDTEEKVLRVLRSAFLVYA